MRWTTGEIRAWANANSIRMNRPCPEMGGGGGGRTHPQEVRSVPSKDPTRDPHGRNLNSYHQRGDIRPRGEDKSGKGCSLCIKVRTKSPPTAAMRREGGPSLRSGIGDQKSSHKRETV